jgi:hypothetical protein
MIDLNLWANMEINFLEERNHTFGIIYVKYDVRITIKSDNKE